MEKLLDQEQINAMFRAMRGQAGTRPAVTAPQAVVTECDLRHPTHLTKEQVRAVTSLHETVGRNLTHSMGAYLRVGFEATVVSVEQLTFAEFLGRLPDVTYLCSLSVSPVLATAILQFDLQLAFPIIDLLLGGAGTPVSEVRPATEIEEELVAGIVKVIARELSAGWASAGFAMEFEERQLPAAAQRFMRPSEKTLVVSFELQIPQGRGMLNLGFPAVVANTLLRKILRDAVPKSKSQTAPDTMIRNLLLDCQFPLRLEIARTKVRLRELLAMTPGNVLTFDHDVREQIGLVAENVEIFGARAVRTERNRGAQLGDRVQAEPEERKS